ncbi:MAG TPA: hypothetical protein VNT03_08310 [Baekduia sp.]|nr:hypothetical protein [Baekduia sp.]
MGRPSPAAGGLSDLTAAVHELPTTEFWALRDELEHEARRRDERRVLAVA